MLSEYDVMFLSPAEQRRIAHITELYNSCRDKHTADMLHREAEDIRARYGYSGGVKGKDYKPLTGGRLDVKV